MNNRTKNLLERAYTIVSDECRIRGELYEAPEYNERVMQVFAELIVHACADAADQAHAADCIYPGDYVVEHMECHGDLGAAVWRCKYD